jgi:alpha-tubulin suppressor-like RCC1 family protein
VPGLSDARALASSQRGAVCALREAGTVRCWGGGSSHADRGFPRTFDPRTAEPSLHDVTRLAVGESFACALTKDGLVSCWGRNQNGELGDGSLGTPRSPVRIAGL